MHVVRLRAADLIMVVAASAALVAAGAALRGRDPATVPVGATADAPRVEARITMRDYRFEPEVLRVPKGARLRLVVTNRGRVVHELEIGGYGLELADVRPGQTVTLVFHADRAGTFELACRRPGHHELGMKGRLVVEAR